MDTNKLTEIGKPWQKNEMKRIYINGLEELYGLRIQRYNSGNVSSATLDGDPISNTAAKQIIEKISHITIWYDYADDDLHVKYDYDKYPQTARKIMDAIRAIAQ
jgi:hypothetical protein